ncbi:MAG: replication restart helicase PriA [Atopobiaceae bacterium]
MAFARVVVDIKTRALTEPYTYAIPPELVSQAEVGCTVLVNFANRLAVAYIIELQEALPPELNPQKIKPIEAVLAASAFDEKAAQLALWIAREYASTLAEAIHLFLPPGQSVKVIKTGEKHWQLVRNVTGAVDERWCELTEEASHITLRKQATRQRQVIEALAEGPMRVAELSALIGPVSQALLALQKRGVLRIWNMRRIRGQEDTLLSSAHAPRPRALTAGQQVALQEISRIQDACAGDVVLVDGITGSGKTEVYLTAIERTLMEGKSAIVLVPEISLTPQTVGRFYARFGQTVAVMHSKLSVGEKFDQWDLVRTGAARVVVGARSALFAPVRNLGLVVIDEEHESSYKQDSAPRYHARDVAQKLVQLRSAALVLGSATPSLESLYRASKKSWRNSRWTRVEMLERPRHAQLPEVEIVDMAQQFRGGGRSIFSPALVEALQEVVARKEKAVLLLNRRGFASFLMCRDCGCVPECPHCSCALTYHERTRTLECHTCGRSWPQRAYPDPLTRCPSCGSRYMGAYGVGTQRVEDELNTLVGQGAEIIRMDADTTRQKGAHQEILERFDTAECAVLVGTQMIAKGLDFPEVTLAAVINADTTLKLPDFRAAERTYDLLEQLSGRAGRGVRPGKVIIQTYWATHPIMQAVKTHDRMAYLTAELEDRLDAYYPPFSRVANVVVWGSAPAQVKTCARAWADELRRVTDAREGWEILGPAECVKAKVKDKVRHHIVIKAPLDADLGPTLLSCAAEISAPKGIYMAVDVDAFDLM